MLLGSCRAINGPAEMSALRDAIQHWNELAYHARIHGEWVERGATIEKFAAANLVRRVTQAAKIPFPLKHASAQAASKAFLAVAQAFVVAARDEDRLQLARFMIAGARCVDAILTEHGHAQAATWRRNFPGEEL